MGRNQVCFTNKYRFYIQIMDHNVYHKFLSAENEKKICNVRAEGGALSSCTCHLFASDNVKTNCILANFNICCIILLWRVGNVKFCGF